MLRGHMKCCPSAVNIFLLKGHTIPYLVRNVWDLVRNMWLPSRCTSHSPSAPLVGADCMERLRWANTDLSVHFRKTNTDPPVHFRKANTDSSMHFKEANTKILLPVLLPTPNLTSKFTPNIIPNITINLLHQDECNIISQVTVN